MSDSNSKKSGTQTSKFAAKQSASHKTNLSVGDLSGIEPDMKKPTSKQQDIGDIKNIDAAVSSDVLGDITLLEEAFAEMEENPEDFGGVGSESIDENDIPMLESEINDSKIEKPSAAVPNASIPVLDQHATETNPSNEDSHSAMPVDPNSNTESNVESEEDSASDIPILTPDSTIEASDNPKSIPQEQTSTQEPSIFTDSEKAGMSAAPSEPITVNTDIKTNVSEFVATKEAIQSSQSQLESSALETNPELEIPKLTEIPEASSQIPQDTLDSELFDLSGLDIDTPSVASASELPPVVTTFAAINDDESAVDDDSIWANELNASKPITSNPSTFQSSTSSLPPPKDDHSKITSDFLAVESSAATSVEDKIANATGETDLMSGFHDIPLANEKISEHEIELASDFVEDILPSALSEISSESLSKSTNFEPSKTESNDNDDTDSKVNMSIPFALHSQLSKKIDELVLDATMSLTTELEHQLSEQLETLLGHAVEAVLPKLIDQMANELRKEVRGLVKRQLPTIVNDVLGKTRLS